MLILKPTKKNIDIVVSALRRGGVIVYPTDTAYALGGIFDSPQVIKKIMAIKKRKDDKFPLIASSMHMVQKYFTFSAQQKKLGKKYWPDALSIIATPRFAVRVPNNDLTRQLARRVGRPLIATSANLSGDVTPYSVQEIARQFTGKKNQPDLILDAGRLPKKKTSTVVRVLGEGRVEVLRKGSVHCNGI